MQEADELVRKYHKELVGALTIAHQQSIKFRNLMPIPDDYQIVQKLVLLLTECLLMAKGYIPRTQKDNEELAIMLKEKQEHYLNLENNLIKP